MRAAVAARARARRPRDGPAPRRVRVARVEPSVLSATFGWGDVSAILEHGARSAELEGPESPWRPVITWALGWAHYCNGDLDAAERWLRETTALAPPRRPMDRRRRRDRGPLAHRRACAATAAEQMRLAREAVALAARARACSTPSRTARSTRRTASRSPPTGRRDEALPALEKGVFLRRLWGQPLDLVDGLLELAPAVAAIGRPRARRGAPRRGRGARGRAAATRARCPARLAAARRAARHRPAPAAAAPDELSERELTVLRLLAQRALRARDRPRALPLVQHRPHATSRRSTASSACPRAPRRSRGPATSGCSESPR